MPPHTCPTGNCAGLAEAPLGLSHPEGAAETGLVPGVDWGKLRQRPHPGAQVLVQDTRRQQHTWLLKPKLTELNKNRSFRPPPHRPGAPLRVAHSAPRLLREAPGSPQGPPAGPGRAAREVCSHRSPRRKTPVRQLLPVAGASPGSRGPGCVGPAAQREAATRRGGVPSACGSLSPLQAHACQGAGHFCAQGRGEEHSLWQLACPAPQAPSPLLPGAPSDPALTFLPDRFGTIFHCFQLGSWKHLGGSLTSSAGGSGSISRKAGSPTAARHVQQPGPRTPTVRPARSSPASGGPASPTAGQAHTKTWLSIPMRGCKITV